MQTIGEQLKQARLAKGLTLQQASDATRVRPHYLEALENDRPSALPSKVQGRGFLRLYADYLGLPAEPLLAIWEGRAPAPDAAPPAPAEASDLPESEILSAPEPVEESPLPEPEEAVIEPAQAFQPAAEAAEEIAEASGSYAVFAEIGQQLKRQRETLGLSLGEVEHYTRLRSHYIEALEAGKLENLPSPVQGRGMLSNYASFLNLDEETILLRFAEGLQERRIERLPAPKPQAILNPKRRPAKQAPFWRRFLTPDLIFGVGVAGIILFFALWTAARISSVRQTETETEPTMPAISAILLTPHNPTASPTSDQATTVAGQQSGSQPGADETPAPSNLEAPFVAPGPGEIPATVAPINADPLQVYIVARQRAWLRVVADDKVQFLGRVVPGNAYAYSGSKQIEISTGNAAALQVFYNQTDLGTLGLTGEVVNLIFSQEGMMTPTAAFTSTPQPTKPATITPLPSATLPATPTITPFVPTQSP